MRVGGFPGGFGRRRPLPRVPRSVHPEDVKFGFGCAVLTGLLLGLGTPISEAQAGPGRLEQTRGQVRPPPPPTRSAAPSRAVTSRPTSGSYRPAYRTTTTTTVRTRSTYRNQRYHAPGAVAPPRSLGRSTPPKLDAEPPRPPFRRLVARYPYEARQDGWVVDPFAPPRAEHRRVAGRLSAEGSYQYRGLLRSGFAARVGSARVDVDTQLSFYYEAPTQDALYLGDTSLNFAPVALPHVVWRVGLGARYMVDGRLPGQGTREYAAGWNFTSSIDIFPARPFIISARVDRGVLYETPVWRGRATVGINYKHVELFAGYDHTQVFRVALGGPLVGLRVWL